MFEQTFKNIDNAFREDDGCSTELDYAEQSSWILFLKWLDDYEKDKETKAKLENKQFKPTLKKEFQWSTWAVVKDKAGKVDFNKTLTGPDLKSFIDDKLFPYLKSFKNNTEDTNTLEYKIGEIFHEIKNKLSDGYSIREVVNAVDNLEFKSSEQKHELSALYEEKIKNMGNSGRNGGEYYTPRALIKSIIQVINPQIGEIIYDGAVGSAGFLIEAYEFMSKSKSLTTSELKTLQNKTFYGIEKISLAYVIGLMNMILHGIESPNIIRKNTLEDNIQEIQNKDRVDVILANPPFGGKTEKKHIQENFPIRTKETSYLFLQHFIKKLKVGGRCAVVIKNTFLSNTDSASISLRKQLLEECNLFTILDLPSGAFLGTGVKTVVLFFEKGKKTEKLWYYQLNVGRNMGKTNPLNEKDLDDFIKLEKIKKLSINSWSINIDKINKDTMDLNANNPNSTDIIDTRTPKEIISEIEKLNLDSTKILNSIKKLIT
jgi:type I restriction enzyme M protein